MSGHSKWANIKHRKGAQDAKRSNVFSRLSKDIMLAARAGGADPASNARLRLAMDKARAANMPKDNVERAIKKGTGQLDGVSFVEVVYEGYGPGGVAVIVDVTTDNKNRSAADIRKIFSKHGGNLGESGSVAWMFHYKGRIVLDPKRYSEDAVLDVALDLGAEDVLGSDAQIEVLTPVEVFPAVADALANQGFETEEAAVELIPENKLPVSDEKTADQLLRLFAALEGNDDVSHFASNAEMSDELMERVLDNE